MKRIAFGICCALLVCVQTSAKEYEVSLNHYVSDSGGGVRAIGQSADFENPPFVLGNIDTQAGWSVFSGNVNQLISSVNPNGGTQHYRNGPEGTGGNVGAFSPDTGPSSIQPQTLSIDVAIGADGGADYDVVPQAPSQGFLTARVKFSFLGDIQVLDDLGAGLAFVDTGADWIPGSYRNLTVAMDPGANTLDYSYDGSLIYSSVAGVYAGTAMEQVVLLSDDFHAGEFGDFDNMSITVIPEPSSLLLLGSLLGFGLIRRR